MRSLVPREIRENIARARGYLRRDELPRALDAMSLALRQSAGSQPLRPVRFELEASFEKLLCELVQHPGMRPLLDPDDTGRKRSISYQKSREGLLAAVLGSLGKMLREAAEGRAGMERDARERRKHALMETGMAHFRAGNVARGRAFLLRVATEFGQEPGVCLDVARRFAALERHGDAAAMFERVLEHGPREPEAYSGAVEACIRAGEYARAEAVFRMILRRFGGHPRTYGRMAQFYLLWGKPDKAEDMAARALQMDGGQVEAQEVMVELERCASRGALQIKAF